VSILRHRGEAVLPDRTFVFVSATEPLAAAQAAWSSPRPIDLCVTAPSSAARETGVFACAGRPVRIVEEPLLSARWPGEDEVGQTARRADALRAVYALDTRCALVVWDTLAVWAALSPGGSDPVVLQETWLLRTAEQIERHLPFP
jgi:hypothetical protein